MDSAEKRKPATMPRIAVDPVQLTKLFSIQLTGPLENALSNRKDVVAVKKVVNKVLVETLAGMSPRPRMNREKSERVRRKDSKKPQAGQEPLPPEDLKADEVIQRGLVEMSLSQLYRATQQGRFYCAKPRGKSNGRVYPSWQFVDPVPDMLPEVLRVLQEQGESRIHARMVTAEDALNELSPAEVLAGRPFQGRSELHSEQSAMLKLSKAERLALVKEIFEEPSREHAIG